MRCRGSTLKSWYRASLSTTLSSSFFHDALWEQVLSLRWCPIPGRIWEWPSTGQPLYSCKLWAWAFAGTPPQKKKERNQRTGFKNRRTRQASHLSLRGLHYEKFWFSGEKIAVYPKQHISNLRKKNNCKSLKNMVRISTSHGPSRVKKSHTIMCKSRSTFENRLCSPKSFERQRRGENRVSFIGDCWESDSRESEECGSIIRENKMQMLVGNSRDCLTATHHGQLVQV